MNCKAQMCRTLLVSAYITISVTNAHSQSVTRIAATDVNAALEQTMKSGARGVMFRTSEDRNAQFIMNRRTAPSDIEVHCEWDDLLLVRSGVGVLRHSRKLRGLRHYGWSEWRAKELVAASDVNLTPGDVLRVPAGEAHTIRSLGDAPLVCLVVKVRSFEAMPCGSLPNKGR